MEVDAVSPYSALDPVWVRLLFPVVSNDAYVGGLPTRWDVLSADEPTCVGTGYGMVRVAPARVSFGEPAQFFAHRNLPSLALR